MGSTNGGRGVKDEVGDYKNNGEILPIFLQKCGKTDFLRYIPTIFLRNIFVTGN